MALNAEEALMAARREAEAQRAWPVGRAPQGGRLGCWLGRGC